VETELESIVQDPQMKGSDGVMPGTILLNAKFTVPAMEKQLEAQHAVVHIASHFVMRPGDDSQSYLLLAGQGSEGTAYHLTVADFRDDQKMSLEGTELLTLSACDTGIGGSSANGREVDGLATTAQRKGAKSVISSLWQLNDDSTAYLMADFYRRWMEGGGKVMKVEALRQAQLDLLSGKVGAKPGSGDASYAQPYYWAPFVLMGNWQ
jgi:CHAT domain-containing protein